MSAYLPTISILVDTHQLPKGIEDDVNIQHGLLNELYEKTTFYKCTTRNWQHTETIRRVSEHLQLEFLDFILEECEMIPFKNLAKLQKELRLLANFIKNNEGVTEYLLADWKNDLEINRKAITANYSEKMFEKTKRYFDEQKAIINALNFSEIFQRAEVLDDISEFALQDKYSPNYYHFIPVIYWLKTQEYLVQQAIQQQKSIVHIMIYP